MAYDYREAVRDDIKDYLEENADYIAENVDVNDRDELEQWLYDTLFTEDSVTGNASGSYTFCRATAKDYVKDNFELACEALAEFGYNTAFLGQKVADEEWEYLDVTIRCYLLGEMINKVLTEREEA